MSAEAAGWWLLRVLGRLGFRRWKQIRPPLVEGLTLESGPSLPASYIFKILPTRSPPDVNLDPVGHNKWGADFGAAYADKTLMAFVISAQVPTRIWDVRVVVTAHHPPISGWHYQSQIGGDDDGPTFVASLGSLSTSGRVKGSWHGPSSDVKDGMLRLPRSVDQNNFLYVQLDISADQGCYEWHVEIDFSTTGQPRRTVREPRKDVLTSSSAACLPLEYPR